MSKIVTVDLSEPVQILSGATWIPEWNFRHLSFWSIAHRFCAANHISSADFKRYFRLASGRMRYLLGVTMPGSPDLRLLDGFDQEKISSAIHDQKRMVVRFCTDKCRDKQALPFHVEVADFLRFCPICLKRGIHTLPSQFIPTRYCILHGIALHEKCPKCSKSIPYTLPGDAGPFSCDCGYQFWDGRFGFNFRVSKRERSWFEEAGDRFWRAFNFACANCPPVLGDRTMLLDHVHAMFPHIQPIPHNVDYSIEQQASYTLIEVQAHRKKQISWSSHRQKQAETIYKSVRRYYYRRLLKHHKPAVRALYRARHFSSYDYSGGGTRAYLRVLPDLDPLALAYIAWRCYWELVSWPQCFIREEDKGMSSLLFRRWIDRYSGFSYEFSWYNDGSNRNLQDSVEIRLLSVRLFGVFEEIVARIAAIQKTKTTDGLNLAAIDERYVSTTYVIRFSTNSAQIVSFRRGDPWLRSKTFIRWTAKTCSTKLISKFRRKAKDADWEPTGSFRWPAKRTNAEGTYLGRGFENGDKYFRTK